MSTFSVLSLGPGGSPAPRVPLIYHLFWVILHHFRTNSNLQELKLCQFRHADFLMATSQILAVVDAEVTWWCLELLVLVSIAWDISEFSASLWLLPVCLRGAPSWIVRPLSHPLAGSLYLRASKAKHFLLQRQWFFQQLSPQYFQWSHHVVRPLLSWVPFP